MANGVMLDPSFPFFGLTLLYLALVFFRFLTTERAKRQICRAFGYYIAPSLLAQIEKNGDELKLGGDIRRITVLFSDMRGFTSLSERVEPQRILQILQHPVRRPGQGDRRPLWHHRQVHRRRHHGLLERPGGRARP
ncbi:MAG: hypothetical protein NVV83_21410 [Afipia sp.]|nr:hypothetical protein [Afipia sp.]